MDLHSQLSEFLLAAASKLAPASTAGAPLERPRSAAHGDYACSMALRMAKSAGRSPQDLAQELASAAEGHPAIEQAQVAGPGFVNLTLTGATRCSVVTEALQAGTGFGRQVANDDRYLLEFVSANPTGPLHIGHGRAAAYGDSLARILRHCGANVTTEYYLNDRGLQADVLASSFWLRVLEVQGRQAPGKWPAGAYAGDYLLDIAKLFCEAHKGFSGVPPDLADLPEEADACAAELASRAKAALGEDFATVRSFVVKELTQRIKDELATCRVKFDNWYSEAEMAASGAIDEGLANFAAKGLTYEKDGAVWFKASKFGDEKDWVVVRSNGEQTYFAADIAYHLDKCKRCPGILYNLFGADHHGYVKRLRAVLAAAGERPERLEIALLQLVALVNAGDRIKMSTRAGRFHALQDLIDALGADSVRLAFVMSKIDAALDFDVSRAASQDMENPVYYLQYAHARSCSLLERWGGDLASLAVEPQDLADEHARTVMAELRWFSTTLAFAARERAPHRIAHWLLALASALHSYYDKVPVLGGDAAGRPSRLALVAATRNALAVGLDLLGVSAPPKM